MDRRSIEKLAERASAGDCVAFEELIRAQLGRLENHVSRRLGVRLRGTTETIVLKCMRKHPESRYNTAQALAQDLERLVKGEPIEAKPDGAWVRLARKARRNRARLVVAAILLVAVLSVTWLAVARARAEYERELALYPEKLRAAVGKLDSGEWVLRAASPPLKLPGIGFRIFEANDFRDVIEVGGKNTVREAIVELEALTRTCPDQPEAHYHLARAHEALDDRALAVRELEQALEVDPTFVAATALREEFVGDVSGDPDSARTARGGRRDWLALREEAGELRRRGDPARAEGVLTQLIDLFEENDPPYAGFLTECYLSRAAARLDLEQYDLAEEDCVRGRAHNPASLHSELLLAMEVYSGDVTLHVRADVGEAAIYGDIHVDLGTSSRFFAGVSRSGRCELGRIDYGRSTEPRAFEMGPLPSADVHLELRSIGKRIESRVWLEGSERPEEPTLQMGDATPHRLGSIGISTRSHPAFFRSVRVETTQ